MWNWTPCIYTDNFQAIGKDIDSIYVEELGKEISKKEMFEISVVDPMMGAIEVDWRDFFPYMKWVPNKSMEMKIQNMATRRRALTKALIMEQKKRISRGEVRNADSRNFLLFLSL